MPKPFLRADDSQPRDWRQSLFPENMTTIHPVTYLPEATRGGIMIVAHQPGKVCLAKGVP
jgi:hypothetical protein